MISYAPLWQTMKRQGASTYTLQVKGGISSSTIRRLKAGDSVSTNTLDALCKILQCTIPDILEYVAEEIMRCDSDSGKKLIKSMVLRTADRQGMC